MGISISIIIPIYNAEEYLKQCLDSIWAQDFDKYEVIGINDRSEDNSSRIFIQYSTEDERFTLLHHDENLGAPSARNTGIKYARGRYLFFLDADDWIAPHALGTLFALAEEDQVDIAMGGLVKCFEGRGSVHASNHAHYMDQDLHHVTVFEAPQLYWSVVSCNKLIRRDFIQNTGLVFGPIPRRFEDMLTYKWYLSGATISVIPEITYFYRQRGSTRQASVTQQWDPWISKDKILAYLDIVSFLVERGYFRTAHDPLHSQYFNLPRFLHKLLRDLINWIQKPPNTSFRSATLDAFETLTQLIKYLPEDYVESLPAPLSTACAYILYFDKKKALDKIFQLYSGVKIHDVIIEANNRHHVQNN